MNVPRRAAHRRPPASRGRVLAGVCLAAAAALAVLPHPDVLGPVPVLQALVPVFCLAALALAVVLALRRRWFPMLAMLSGAMLGILPVLVPATGNQLPPGGSSMAILSINVEHSHADVQALAAAVRVHHVEVLVLVETDESLIEELLGHGIREILPFRSATVTPGDTAGTAILSAHPLLAASQIPVGGGQTSFDQPWVTIDHPRLGPLRVAAVHPYAPVVAGAGPWRAILGSIEQWQSQHTELPLVLAGDFNASRSHPAFRKLAHGFVDTSTEAGPFPIPTWPADLPGPAVFAIDHILVRGLDVTGWQRVRIPGTDHFGVLATIGARAAASG